MALSFVGHVVVADKNSIWPEVSNEFREECISLLNEYKKNMEDVAEKHAKFKKGPIKIIHGGDYDPTNYKKYSCDGIIEYITVSFTYGELALEYHISYTKTPGEPEYARRAFEFELEREQRWINDGPTQEEVQSHEDWLKEIEEDNV